MCIAKFSWDNEYKQTHKKLIALYASCVTALDVFYL